MAVTKIHPIKSTLNLAIDYITNSEKTDQEILISTHKCHVTTAHTQFLKRREQEQVHGTVLARHLIQSFLPGEISPELAHEIGLELCKRILKDEYEFVLSTHIDKYHIHNHIIFNNVNMITGKCYQSNKKTYHQIRYQSDLICKEKGLSIIDEYYEIFKKKYKTKGKSWYEDNQRKQGISWKSKLQFDIDRVIRQSKNWDDFLSKMEKLDYEIKHGKHIAFRHKDKERFTRGKTIGEDYSEKRLKERVTESLSRKRKLSKEQVGNIINLVNNSKVQASKGYEFWATKHNLKSASKIVLLMREKGIKSFAQIDKAIQESATKRQELQDKMKKIEHEINQLSMTMENIHTIKKYRHIYQVYKEDTTDKAFLKENQTEITLYRNALKNLKKSYAKLPNTKKILTQLDLLQEKKNTLFQEYSSTKSYMTELYKIRKNYEKYMENEVER